MAAGGNWLTPTHLGRYALNKPPLFQWLTAACIRLTGISAASLRVPSLMSAALAAVLLLCLWMTAAVVALPRDPAMEHDATVWGCGAATGAALLTKRSAGAPPLLAIGIYRALAPRGTGPRTARMPAAAGIAVAAAIPWHLYQLAVHPRWSMVEYILQQHLSVDVFAPPQYSN